MRDRPVPKASERRKVPARRVSRLDGWLGRLERLFGFLVSLSVMYASYIVGFSTVVVRLWFRSAYAGRPTTVTLVG